MIHNCDPSTRETKAAGFRVQRQLELPSEFKTTLVYTVRLLAYTRLRKAKQKINPRQTDV